MPTKFSDIDEDRFLAMGEAEREAVTDAWLARREHHHQPRFGPDRQVALSLDSPAGADDDETWCLGDTIADASAIDFRLPADVWDKVVRALQLTPAQTRIFHARYRRQIPPYNLSRELGICPRYVDAALDSIAEKLRSPLARALYIRLRLGLSPLPQSRGSSYREHARWGLVPLPDSTPAIVRAERRDLYSIQPVTRRIAKPKLFYPGKSGGQIIVKPLPQLLKELTTEDAKLTRLNLNVERKRAEKRDAIEAESATEAASIEARTEAAFSEKDIAEDFARKLAAAHTRVVSADADLIAAIAAATKQAGIVDGIKAEIASRQYQSMLAAIAAPRAKVFQKLAEAADAIRELYQAVGDNGGAPRGINDIYPPTDPQDREADYGERFGLAQLTDAILRFDAGRPRTGDLGKPYYRRMA